MSETVQKKEMHPWWFIAAGVIYAVIAVVVIIGYWKGYIIDWAAIVGLIAIIPQSYIVYLAWRGSRANADLVTKGLSALSALEKRLEQERFNKLVQSVEEVVQGALEDRDRKIESIKADVKDLEAMAQEIRADCIAVHNELPPKLFKDPYKSLDTVLQEHSRGPDFRNAIEQLAKRNEFRIGEFATRLGGRNSIGRDISVIQIEWLFESAKGLVNSKSWVVANALTNERCRHAIAELSKALASEGRTAFSYSLWKMDTSGSYGATANCNSSDSVLDLLDDRIKAAALTIEKHSTIEKYVER